MQIGILIKQYRKTNDLTLREFARKCGTSHSYIAMLENSKNSKTGEPIVPTIVMMKKLAKGMEITVSDLISLCDDMKVSLNPLEDIAVDLQLFAQKETSPAEPELSEGEKILLELFRQIPEEQQKVFLEMGRVYANSLKKD